jgi:hypothetical protein
VFLQNIANRGRLLSHAVQLDAEIAEMRRKIAALQDELGQIHRDRSLDLNEVAARQQGLLGKMADAQRRLATLDDERRGFSPERRR